jgi:hypothetical protein
MIVLCHFGACSNQPNPSRAIISSRLLSVGQQAAHFDFAIRRVESSRPSHAFSESADFAACGAEPRIPRAFAGAEIGDRQNRVCRGGFVRPVSNADFPISGIC